MVAVGGDSGTGKMTLCEGLRTIFGDDRCVEVRLDGYFGLNRAQRNAVGITALDPRAHNFAAMHDDLRQLSHGRAIVKPVYDHLKGAATENETVEPREIVLVQGLFPLYTWALRSLFDVSVWMEPDPELKTAWTIHRDVKDRAYREEQVRAELDRRRQDYTNYIAPQAQYADIRASYTKRGVTFEKSGRLPPLDYADFASDSTRLQSIPDPTSPYPRTIIEVDADIPTATAETIEDAMWNRIETRRAHSHPGQLGTYRDPTGTHVSHALALAQLLVARRIGLVAERLAQAVSV
jgi:phosphoribulokinase